MGFFSDVFDFEKFNLKEMAGKIKDKPHRLLMGSIDPLSTKLWNKVTGSDDEPIIGQMGGASKDTYEKAEAAGIDTKSGKKMHDAAKIVASVFAAKGLAGSGAASKAKGLFSGGSEGMLGKIGDGAGFMSNILKSGQQGAQSTQLSDGTVDFGETGVDRVGRYADEAIQRAYTPRPTKGFFGTVLA